jgi:hypothetical protein
MSNSAPSNMHKKVLAYKQTGMCKNSVIELKKIIVLQPIALCLDDSVELQSQLVSYFKNSEKRRKDVKYKKSRT